MITKNMLKFPSPLHHLIVRVCFFLICCFVGMHSSFTKIASLDKPNRPFLLHDNLVKVYIEFLMGVQEENRMRFSLAMYFDALRCKC